MNNENTQDSESFNVNLKCLKKKWKSNQIMGQRKEKNNNKKQDPSNRNTDKTKTKTKSNVTYRSQNGKNFSMK